MVDLLMQDNIIGIEFDKLKMYFGEDYVINDKIVIHQPTIGEILEYGEKEYLSMVHTICAIPSDMKPQLWDMGIDYDKITDFELFRLLRTVLPQFKTKILLGDLDLSSLYEAQDQETEEIILADFEKGIVIDQYIYLKIVTYIRQMHGIIPKIEHAYNEYTKKILIEDDRQKQAAYQKKPYSSQLLPLVSSMLNSAGFKYKKNELKEVGIVEFMDSVYRISKIQSTNALLHGFYGGMIDTTKIDKKELNWLGELKY